MTFKAQTVPVWQKRPRDQAELPKKYGSVWPSKRKTIYQDALEQADAENRIKQAVLDATGKEPSGRIDIYRESSSGQITERSLAASMAEAIAANGGTPSDEIMRAAGYSGKKAKEILAAGRSRLEKQWADNIRKRSV